VRNNLQVISTVLYLQTIGMPEGELRHGFRRTQQRIDGLGLLFRNLLGQSRITSVRFDSYLVDLCTSLVGGFDAPRQLRRGADVGALSLELDMAGPLGLVIGEILFTASDYASPDPPDPENIPNAGNGLEVSIQPDGTGLVLHFEFDRQPTASKPFQIGGHSALGTTVMSALVNQLDARLTMREDGDRVAISLGLPRTLFEFG
jgi:two-component sensor histidine kinase